MEPADGAFAIDAPALRVVLAPVKAWILWLALLTPLTHAWQIGGASFRSYAVAAVTAALAATVVTGRAVLCGRRAADASRAELAVALALCLAGAVFALALHRPDADDYNYASAAVYHLEHGAEPMDFRVPCFYVEGAPLRSISYGTSQAFEYASAACAFLLGLPFLTLYHVVVPALMGFAMVAAFLAALATFTRQVSHALVGTTVFLAIVPLLADTHRAFANFSFARAYQGKVLLIAVGVPLLIAGARVYLARPSLAAWAALLATATAMVGATASAILLVPALLVLMLAGHVAEVRHVPPVRVLVAYAATGLYMGVFAVSGLSTFARDLGPDSIINVGWPRSFGGQLSLMVDWPSASPVMFLTAIAVALARASAAIRRFLLGWLAAAAGLLNPWTTPWLTAHVAMPAAYWRLFFLWPFPLVIGLATVVVLEGCSPPQRPILVGLALVAPLFMLAIAPSLSVLRPENHTRLAWPVPKLDPVQLAAARAVRAAAPPGPMLAPGEVAGILGLLTSAYPQIRVREEQLLMWIGQREGPAAARHRLRASRFTEGDPAAFDDFVFVLDRYRALRSVVLVPSAAKDGRARNALETRGFEEMPMAASVGLWVRDARE